MSIELARDIPRCLSFGAKVDALEFARPRSRRRLWGRGGSSFPDMLGGLERSRFCFKSSSRAMSRGVLVVLASWDFRVTSFCERGIDGSGGIIEALEGEGDCKGFRGGLGNDFREVVSDGPPGVLRFVSGFSGLRSDAFSG